MFKQYFNDFKRFEETGDVLTKKERMLLEWANYLFDNTKFKNIVLNYFDNITFETKNRNFTLKINDDYSFSLYYDYNKLIVDNGKCKDYSTPSDIMGNKIVGNFYDLRDWFKKRNYLKK